MRHAPYHLILIACAAAFACNLARADIRDTPDERSLSLSAGVPALVLKRGDWVVAREQTRVGDSAVYYMLTSESLQMVLSAYVDRTDTCRSADSCLGEALKNQSYKDAKEQRLFSSGPFAAAQFYLDEPSGAPLKQAHVLASAYVDGHWFDVHISKASRERPDMAPLLELLRSLVVR